MFIIIYVHNLIFKHLDLAFYLMGDNIQPPGSTYFSVSLCIGHLIIFLWVEYTSISFKIRAYECVWNEGKLLSGKLYLKG